MKRTENQLLIKENLLTLGAELKGKEKYGWLPPIPTTALAFGAGMALLGSTIGLRTAVILALISALLGAFLRYSRERTNATQRLFDTVEKMTKVTLFEKEEVFETLAKELETEFLRLESLRKMSLVNISEKKFDEARSNLRTWLKTTRRESCITTAPTKTEEHEG